MRLSFLCFLFLRLANSVQISQLASDKLNFKLRVLSARYLEPSKTDSKTIISDHFICITDKIENTEAELQVGLSADNAGFDCWLQLIAIAGKSDVYNIWSPSKNVSLYMWGSVPRRDGDTELIKEMFLLRAHPLVDNQQISAEFQLKPNPENPSFYLIFHPMYQFYLRAAGNRKDPEPAPVVGYIAATAALNRGIVLDFGGDDFEIKL